MADSPEKTGPKPYPAAADAAARAGPVVTASALAARLQALIGKESVSSFARRCGLAESVLRTYLKDGRMPPLDKALAIAAAAGVSIDWLATGMAAQRAAEVPVAYDVASVAGDEVAQVDLGVLKEILAAVLAAGGGKASPDELAARVVDAYRRAMEAAAGVDRR